MDTLESFRKISRRGARDSGGSQGARPCVVVELVNVGGGDLLELVELVDVAGRGRGRGNKGRIAMDDCKGCRVGGRRTVAWRVATPLGVVVWGVDLAELEPLLGNIAGAGIAIDRERRCVFCARDATAVATSGYLVPGVALVHADPDGLTVILPDVLGLVTVPA